MRIHDKMSNARYFAQRRNKSISEIAGVRRCERVSQKQYILLKPTPHRYNNNMWYQAQSAHKYTVHMVHIVHTRSSLM